MTESSEGAAMAIAAARAHAAAKNWPFVEPIEVMKALWKGVPVYNVRTNTLAVGRNARFVIRQSDGEVLEAAFLAR
jgi:hypothetical protein